MTFFVIVAKDKQSKYTDLNAQFENKTVHGRFKPICYFAITLKMWFEGVQIIDQIMQIKYK